MKRKTAILYGESWLEDENLDAEDKAFIEEALQALKQEPCDDMVSRGVFEQVMWERDVAISQLKKLGYELGQKVEPCEDKYIKVPKKALKYRTAGMVAYNAEWLKNHFDIERIAICGEQQPCEDAIRRQAVLDGLASIAKAKAKSDAQKSLMGRVMFFVEQLPSVNPQPCEDAIRRQDVLDLAKKGVLVSNGNYDSVCKAINEIPSVNLMPCDDAISRQAAIDACDQSINLFEAVDRLKELPPVTQKSDNKYRKEAKRWKNKWLKSQKSGKWIVHEKPHGIRYLECPYCNVWYLNEHLIRNSYCPNCGARMIESEDKG